MVTGGVREKRMRSSVGFAALHESMHVTLEPNVL